MKEKKERWTPDFRKIALVILGFLLGRVWLFEINPFGVAFFASICGEGLNKRLMAVAVLLGMFTSADGIGLLKYIVLFSLILIADSMQQKVGQAPTPFFLSLLCGGLNLLLGAALSLLSVNTWEMLGMSALESVAVFALANVYQWGIRFFLYGEWRRTLGNEELISILTLLTTALCAIPDRIDDVFSIVGTLGYLAILFMGFRYGAATGTMAGAAGGILSVVTGGDPVMVGVCCLLGVSVGIFRKIGRIGSSIAFFLMGYCMIYFLQGQSAGIVELRAMVSAIVIFLALPRSIVREVEEDEKEQKENLFAKEDVRALANYKIGDFADAFKRLSKSFSEGDFHQNEVTPEEIEEIYEELSEKICSGCANCNFCWDKHLQETRDNIHAIIRRAGEDESAAAQISPEFGRRCIRLDAYAEYAAERMAVAKMNLGWRNRMAENREIIARQMMEVSNALRSFTLEIGEPGEISTEERRTIVGELKKEGVRLHQISVKRRRGRLEVAFTGSCRGHRCLTKTDLAKALSRAAGVKMCPGRECRNVLSEEEVLMFFREDTRYKALTGIARIAKSGEQVSGDNYSFMELLSGELLMLLADGMGSGEMAYRDSGSFLEVLEHLMEAGFEKKSALRMLNTLFVMNFEGRTFTTLDMVSLDLYTGVCEIMKNGAAATFIKRKSRVDTIQSEALPVGVDMEAESDVAVTRLEEGDMVIMVSDGVIDGFDRKRENLEKLIGEMVCQNPNDMANQILMHALAGSTREATDDMSVLVAGLWIKNPS